MAIRDYELEIRNPSPGVFNYRPVVDSPTGWTNLDPAEPDSTDLMDAFRKIAQAEWNKIAGDMPASDPESGFPWMRAKLIEIGADLFGGELDLRYRV